MAKRKFKVGDWVKIDIDALYDQGFSGFADKFLESYTKTDEFKIIRYSSPSSVDVYINCVLNNKNVFIWDKYLLPARRIPEQLNLFEEI